MLVIFEVASRTETLKLDGETQFVLHGKLTVTMPGMDEQEIGQVGIAVSDQTWRHSEPGCRFHATELDDSLLDTGD